MTNPETHTWAETKNPHVYKEYRPLTYTNIKQAATGKHLFIVQRIKRIPRWTIQTYAKYDDKTQPLATFKSLEAAKLAYRLLPKRMPA